MKSIEYMYKNLPIPGGGYVTGFLFHKKQKDILYARTDIGGTYRFDTKTQTWISLIPHVTAEDLSETFPISIALDDGKPNMLYIACGVNAEKSGVLAVSENYGESFTYKKIPVLIHGNLNGRGTGERLIVDRYDADTLYFASQQEGLWVSHDKGSEWKKLAALKEQYLTFVSQIGSALLVGTAGVSTMDVQNNMRGHSLYISYDNGMSFEELAQPESRHIEGCKLNGLAAQRWAADDKYLYITFASTGRRSYVSDNGYSCDSGDTIDGRIARYEICADGTIGTFKEITPILKNGADTNPQPLEYGFSGIDVSALTSGMLVCTTIVKDDGDSVYRSYDYGESWEEILYDLSVGRMMFRASYMRPEYNGGHSLIHWLSDIKINPHNDNEAWFNSGTGVFRTTSLKDNKRCEFSDWCDGIEETVHLNVYSLPKGEVQVIDILGDLGGFAFSELDKPCENSFADENGNRYITCINADFSDLKPQNIIVTPRGNWTGKTKGGLIMSEDYGKTFRRLDMPFGISPELDDALKAIETPNVNSGWAALSPDSRNIVWSVAKGIELPISRLIASNDMGVSFVKCIVYDLNKKQVTDGNIKVFSDRVSSSIFYGFGSHSEFYVSSDCGRTYYQQRLSDDFPIADFGLIDCANKTEVRGEAGKSGVFYMALGKYGLWKLEYKSDTDVIKTVRLSSDKDAVYRVGLGIGSEGGDYFRDKKAVYFNGVIDGEYGFYRTLDDGKSYERLNTEKQMYGEINSIDADCRVFGRFYIATGSNGVKYAEPTDVYAHL